MTKEFDPQEVQGNILRGYRHPQVRYLILEVTDARKARAFLGASADGTNPDEVPAITRSVSWDTPPDTCFNIGITYLGLKTLGLPDFNLGSFPLEYAEGMENRSEKLGDIGESAPENWDTPFDTPERVHLVASIYGFREAPFDAIEAQVARAFEVLGVRNGRTLDQGKVFFDYVDGISNPKFTHVFDPAQAHNEEPEDPLGTVLLGYPTHFEGVEFRVPQPKDVFRNGAFNAFRVLKQDTGAFEAYLTEAAKFLEDHEDVQKLLPEGAERNIGGGMSRHDALREVVAAQMCGRWRTGTPYELSPNSDERKTKEHPNGISLTNYNYHFGSRCAAGAHMRRANPRGGPIVQRVANYSRRLVRRGMSYGDPENGEHGLLGNFIGANFAAQFEAVMCDWINFGLQDPDITGTNDPLLGANSPETSAFDLTLPEGGRIRLTGFPRFVSVRGGAYTFLPSLPALRYLAQLRP